MRWTAALVCLVLMVTSACEASPDTYESTTSTRVRAETGSGLTPGDGVANAVAATGGTARSATACRHRRVADDPLRRGRSDRGLLDGSERSTGHAPRVEGLDRRSPLPGLRVPPRRLRRRDRAPGVDVTDRPRRPVRPARSSSLRRPAPWWRRGSESLTVDTVGLAAWLLRAPAPRRFGLGEPDPLRGVLADDAGTVALVAPVTTWQAYNLWGGYSLYEGPAGDRRSWAVSFDRPYAGVGGMNDFRTAVVPIVVQAERSGVPAVLPRQHRPAGRRPARRRSGLRLHGPRRVLDADHADTVQTARDAGTNLAFLGANTMYWRVRLEDRGTGAHRLMTGYRDDAALDPLRDERPARRPHGSGTRPRHGRRTS